jgi:hypothetical protein
MKAEESLALIFPLILSLSKDEHTTTCHCDARRAAAIYRVVIPDLICSLPRT